jgi:two-component system, cell cycle sensor histidine kinase and response regulator CckA
VSVLDVPSIHNSRGSETILLVEDSSDLRDVICQFLKIDGYNVLEAEDATQAVQIAGQHEGPIHLILTDVVLPGESGRILAEQLMLTRPESKVLFMSGYTDDTALYHQVLQATLNFIHKPFTRSELVSKVRHVLDEKPARVVTSGRLLMV